jgi:hypothetical protein
MSNSTVIYIVCTQLPSHTQGSHVANMCMYIYKGVYMLHASMCTCIYMHMTSYTISCTAHCLMYACIVCTTASLVCKQYEEVIALLKDMLRRNLKPSPATFANGMAAYGALHNYEGAVKILPSMRSFNVSNHHFTHMYMYILFKSLSVYTDHELFMYCIKTSCLVRYVLYYVLRQWYCSSMHAHQTQCACICTSILICACIVCSPLTMRITYVLCLICFYGCAAAIGHNNTDSLSYTTDSASQL